MRAGRDVCTHLLFSPRRLEKLNLSASSASIEEAAKEGKF